MLEVIEPGTAGDLEADHPQDELVQQGDSPRMIEKLVLCVVDRFSNKKENIAQRIQPYTFHKLQTLTKSHF